jgi:short-subunit dehydrogenase
MNILIIGATSGIGNSLYSHYISCGNRVAIMGRRKNILDEICAANPTDTLALQVDISDINSFSNAFEEVVKSFQNIDLAILCAGIGELNEPLDIKQELATLSTNVVGWTNVVDTLYNHFEKTGKGHLVTITSVGGLQPTPIAPSYSASKAFQINYTKSLQAKARKTAITVTEIRPGLVDTRMAKGNGLFWVMPLDKVSKQIIKAIDNKKKLCVVTKRWRILNYIVKHFL